MSYRDTSPLVQSVLAGAIVDADFARRFVHRRDPHLLRHLSRKEREDLRDLVRYKLRLFRATLLRIRFNFLWAIAPETIQQLKKCHIELDVFLRVQQVIDRAAPLKRPHTTEERFRVFSKILRRYLKRRQLNAMCCLFDHETTMWRLRSMNLDFVAPLTDDRHTSNLEQPLNASSRKRVLARRCPLVVRAFPMDPTRLVRGPSQPKNGAERTAVLYWRDEAGDVRAMPIPILFAQILRKIDGKRSTASILRALARETWGRRVARQVDQFLTAAIAARILGFSR